jgi:hypothetical protein
MGYRMTLHTRFLTGPVVIILWIAQH